ncbi:DUF3137 domain-containing protein [Cellulophaga sp. BC115SP]|jgi:hypothetical protein|uniref:DUF3137 domain-containing protein n=1 Tax=Cellulophaga sp. BC115SP TaxID=2683263 RepID=UPI00141263F0|nr:DUF3137 domain-containing protein [Cellulophaga sp. BC115SP]NBB30275.1 DUF3137 domain-containing protein [Cellulophaga sp. BC115SP]
MGFLKNIFGPSKEEIWVQLEQEINARLINKDSFWHDSKVVLEHKNWTIILDVFHHSSGKSSTPYTRMRCAYINKDDFRFTIYPEGLFTDLAKYFGMQDIEIEDKIFDDTFVLKSENPDKIKTLFNDNNIKNAFFALADLSQFQVKVQDDEGFWSQSFPDDVDELYLEALGVIKDLVTLKNMFKLFAEIMDRLCEIGSAYETHPTINLE